MITIPMNPAEIISCPAVTTFMQKGNENVVKEVANLQSALKNIEKMDVDVNGEFDDRTEAAVKAFQRKYASEVLAPWDATKPSGIVNITTAKKINQIACAVPLTLNKTDLDVMNAYKSRGTDVAVSAAAPVYPDANPQVLQAGAADAPAVPVVPMVVVTDRAPIFDGTSLSSRFGRYFGFLFGR